MTKAKHGICIAALMAALGAPSAWAGGLEAGPAGWFDYLLAQLESLWMGDETLAAEEPATATSQSNADQPELGPAALPNG